MGKISKDSTIRGRINTTTTLPIMCECTESGVSEAGRREELGRKFENLGLLEGVGPSSSVESKRGFCLREQRLEEEAGVSWEFILSGQES